MNKEISNIRLRFPCSENWDESGSRHCAQCNKEVFDFTNTKAEDFQKILAENNGSVCGRFTVKQLAPVKPALPLWKKWLSAAMILISVSTFNKVVAQKLGKRVDSEPYKRIIEIPVVTSINPDEPVGGEPIPISQLQDRYTKAQYEQDVFTAPEASPNFPGGITKFYEYLNKVARYPAQAEKAHGKGRVVVQFIVERDGHLSNVKALRSPGFGLDQEAVRIVTTSPKWQPGMQNGNKVRVQYTIQVTFV